MRLEVYLVQAGFDYEGSSTLSAWSTYREARRWAEKHAVRHVIGVYCDYIQVLHLPAEGRQRLVFELRRNRFRGRMHVVNRFRASA